MMKNKIIKKSHPIFDAILGAHPNKIKEYVAKGCDLNNTFEHKYTEGWTPLMCALYWCPDSTNIVQMLVELGADVHQKTKIIGEDAIGACFMQGSVKNFDYLISKMDTRFNIDAKDEQGQTFLMRAATHDWPQMIECLLKYKPQLDLKNKNGKTALQIAKIHKAKDAIEILEKAVSADKIEKEQALLEKSLNSTDLSSLSNHKKAYKI